MRSIKMPSKTEIERLAGAANSLRPEWPVRSLVTFLERNHSARSYADLAVAIAVVATDPKTQTPARLNEAGPWWRQLPNIAQSPPKPQCPVHPEQRGHGTCDRCKAEAVPSPGIRNLVAS